MTWRARTTIHPDRPTWLAARTATLGASEAAALLGCSPFAGPWHVWTAKRGGPPVPEADEPNPEGGVDLNDPKIRGQVLEPMVGLAYTLTTTRPHRPVCPLPAIGITRHALHAWLTASIDATVDDPELATGVGEWKSAKDSWKWGPTGTVLDGRIESFAGIIPLHIGIQALVQLAVTGLPFCDVAVFTGGLAFRWYRVLRHEDTLDALVDELHRLWILHIVDCVTPDLDGSAACIAYCRAQLQAGRAKSRRATEEEADDIAVLVARRRAEADADAAKARILLAMGDCAKLTLAPGPRGEPRGVRVDVRGGVTAFGD